MYLVYNSDILPENDFTASPINRAFQYGDGLFETIRYENGTVWFWADHVDRLKRGMRALHLNLPAGLTEATIYQAVLQLLLANKLTNQPARIKLQVWRRPGGLYTPTTSDADYLVTARPGRPFAVTESNLLGIFEDMRLSSSSISAFKTLNALPYVLAGLYKQHHDFDDVLLLDTQGHLAECIASSLFWFKGGTLFTPSLKTGCIEGIIRRQLFRLYPVNEGLFRPDVLTEADTVFCTNIAGIQWFKHFKDRTFADADKLIQEVERKLMAK